MPRKQPAPLPDSPPAPALPQQGEPPTPTLLLLNPSEIQAPEELNTRRFQTTHESIASLAHSLLHDGQQQPIGVTQLPDSTYVLKFGWRRWQAASLINDTDPGGNHTPFLLQALVTQSYPPPKGSPSPDLIAGIVENTQRIELGPIDQAYAIKILTDSGLRQRDIATKMGISQFLVSQRLRLLDLPPNLQRQVNSGEVPIDTALLTLSTTGEPPPPPFTGFVNPLTDQIDAEPGELDALDRAEAGLDPLVVSDKDVRIDRNYINTDTNVLNQDSQPKSENVAKSKTAKQMISELTGYATPDDYNNSVGRTPAQRWVLTRLIPWISKSTRPFQKAMEELEKMAGGG